MTAETRKVLRLSGTDVRQFLQGLVTNDVEKLSHGIVYAALLTPQGKYRADFFLVPDGDDILLDLHADLAPGLVQALTMYKLRSDVVIEDTNITVTCGLGNTPNGAFADPRDASLGWRAYDGRPGQEVDWTELRVAACVPTSGVELNSDTFILEANFEKLNGVDFKKGCYVGQEVTARMKHKTELRKGLAVVDLSGKAPVGTAVFAGEKPAGTLFTQSGNRAIAYLRFDRAQGQMTAGAATLNYRN